MKIDYIARVIILAILLIVVFAIKLALGWSSIEYFMTVSTALLTLIYLRVIDDER